MGSVRAMTIRIPIVRDGPTGWHESMLRRCKQTTKADITTRSGGVGAAERHRSQATHRLEVESVCQASICTASTMLDRIVLITW